MIEMLLLSSFFMNLANTNNVRHLRPDASPNKLRNNEGDFINVFVLSPNNLDYRRTIPMEISSGVNAPITRRQTADDTQEQDNNKEENDEFQWASPEDTAENITDSTNVANNGGDSEDDNIRSQILNHLNSLKETSAKSIESPSDDTSEIPNQTNTNISLENSSKNITEESVTKEEEKSPIARASPDLPPPSEDQIFEGDDEEPAQSRSRNKASMKCLKYEVKYCIKSCKKAGKTACKAYSCKRRMRHYFKKTCKEKCKERFLS